MVAIGISSEFWLEFSNQLLFENRKVFTNKELVFNVDCGRAGFTGKNVSFNEIDFVLTLDGK